MNLLAMSLNLVWFSTDPSVLQRDAVRFVPIL
jgi:hypothetical protein